MTAWLLNYNNGAATHTEKDTKIIRKKNEDEVTGHISPIYMAELKLCA